MKRSASTKPFDASTKRFLKKKLCGYELDGQGRVQLISPGENDTDDVLKRLTPFLTEMREAQFLRSDISDHGLALLASASKLETLLLFNCPRLTGHGVRHLVPLGHLRELTCDIRREPNFAMRYARQIHSLREIDSQRIGDVGLAELAGHPGIEKVGFCSPEITDGGIPFLAELPGLRSAGLDNCRCGDRGAKHLAKIVRLERLSVPWHSLTDEGLRELTSLQRLTFLALSKTSITDAGLDSLRTFPDLQELYLYGTAITDAGLRRLHGLQNLTSLVILNTKTTAKGVSRLRETLSLKCEIDHESIRPIC